MIVSDKPKIELLHIDCMEYMKTVPDKYFELAIVDPPFGIGSYWEKETQNGNKEKFGKHIWNKSIPTSEYFTELFRVSRHQIIWGGNYYTDFLQPTNSWIFWDKKRLNHTYSDGELAWTSLPISLKQIELSWDGYRKCEEVTNSTIHPCQKPIKLYRWLLKNYAKEGDKIFDSHGGSRSLAIACHQMGFDHVSCEIDLDYHNDSVKRFKEQTMQIEMKF